MAGLLAVIYGFSIATLVLPDKEFSEQENRYLQKKPSFSISRLINGEFTSEIADYFSDQIPLRDIFVGAKASAEIALLKRENDDVLLGSDGYIIAKDDQPELERARKNASAVNSFREALSSDEELSGISVRLAVAGRSQDVLRRYMPSLYPAAERTEELFGAIDETLAAPRVDILTPLTERADNGEYVYYRTDHHWTALGAYYAYAEIMCSFDMEPNPIEHYSRERVTDEFFGTTWSKAGMKWVGPDEMEFFRWDGDEDIVTEIVDTGRTIEGMYDRSRLGVKDKYGAIIGGNNGYVRIYGKNASDEARERLILINDSFGHAVAPFLAEHFELEIVDLRYYRQSVAELVRESGAEKILILVSADSFASSNALTTLTYGLYNE